jgi:hypothetical protein
MTRKILLTATAGILLLAALPALATHYEFCSSGQQIVHLGISSPDNYFGNDSAAGECIDVVQDAYDADRVRGFAGPDTIVARGGADSIDGGGGHDPALYGGDGGDVVIGGNGTDVLYGGYGDDTLFDGNNPDKTSGGDHVHGGPGFDTWYHCQDGNQVWDTRDSVEQVFLGAKWCDYIVP